jgi:hypothetical protein
MIDLTGWTPHEGNDNPAPAKDGNPAPDVRVVIRGRPTNAINGGPKESGPSPSTAFVWEQNEVYPASDIVAWRLDSDPTPFVRYPAVRKDMGLGR